MNYFNKYLKYKKKYLLQKQYGGLTNDQLVKIKYYLNKKYESLVKKLNNNLDTFINSYIGQNNKCIDAIVNDNECTFIKNLQLLWNSEHFTGYNEDKENLSKLKFAIRCSTSMRNNSYIFVLYYLNKKTNTIKKQILLIDYVNEQIIHDSIVNNIIFNTEKFPFDNFIKKFEEYFDNVFPKLDYIVNISSENGGMNSNEVRTILVEKIENYANIDKVLILTFQFMIENNKSFLPGEGENLNINEIAKKYYGTPGLTALIIADEYKTKINSDAKIEIILSNDPNKQDKINTLTNKSRLIIVGHCCKEVSGEHKIIGVKGNMNTPMGPNDFLELLKNNKNLKNNNHLEFRNSELIISVYACEATYKFCLPLSKKLFANKILSILKCRPVVVSRLSKLEVEKAQNLYVSGKSESCQTPNLIFNGRIINYNIENDI